MNGKITWFVAVVVTGMLHVAGTVDFVGHQRHVLIADGFDCRDLLNRNNRIDVDVGVAQGNSLSPLDSVD